MELRHLRYFVAVAEAGSFTQAATQRLHTAQPSLSRQIHDLEDMVGTQLIIRGPRGLQLTPAGTVLLDHARAILAQVALATEATRQAAEPRKLRFTVGFLTGHEIGWLPRVLAVLQPELHRTELIIHSASSPELTEALLHGTMDMAFLRPVEDAPALEFLKLLDESLFVLLPATHPLASRKRIRAEDLRQQSLISFARHYSPVLRRVIDDYLRHAGLDVVPAHEAETLPMVISLALATGSVTLLPAYMKRLLPPSVVARPLAGRTPTIPLALAHNKANPSPLLRHLLSRSEAFMAAA